MSSTPFDFPHVRGYSCPIDSLTVKLINKMGWIGMSTGGECQELFQKGEDRNVNWA